MLLVAAPASGITVCTPRPSVHGYAPAGIVSAEASSAAGSRSGLVKRAQLGREEEAGMEFVTEMGRGKRV
jgi:hypothetical protein